MHFTEHKMAMTTFKSLVILLLVTPSLANTSNNEIEVDEENSNPFMEVASNILKEQGAQNIGSLLNNFMASGGAKQVSDVLSNLANGDNGGQLLQTVGSLLGGLQNGNNRDGDGGGGGLDPAVIGGVLNLLSNMQQNNKPSIKKQRKDEDTGLDLGDIMNLASTFLGSQNSRSSSSEGLLELLPIVMKTVSAFIGPEADKRAASHADHSWMLPPVVEKFHLLFDNFLHSEMGQMFINTIGAEKAFKVFSDENGRFNYEKFGEMLENHSFRRHWISMVTTRLIEFLTVVSEPKVQKRYFSAGQFFFNSYFKSQGFPKSTMFDPSKPTESLTAFVNYAFKQYVGMKISSKQYIKPAVEYVQELLRLAQKRGASLKSENIRELSNKLADTINMEIIEPIVRVNRAYRFIKSVPECDRYVLCLVNEVNPNEQLSLPGLKEILSKGSSLLASWFLSEHTGTPFWTLYTDITEDVRCKTLYKNQCNEFHVEEEKVTTEYVHNEL